MRYVRSKFLPLAILFLLSSCGFFGIGTDGDDDESKPSKVAAFVFNVTSTADDGTYGPGAVIPIVVTFTKPVIVEGTPQLAINTGAGETILDYAEGSGTNLLVFPYTVAPGDFSTDLDFASKTALTLNGGTIKGPEQEAASLTLVDPGTVRSLADGKNLVIDTVAPSILSVGASTANGTFGVGDAITVTVTFNEPVVVTGGTPQLTLETGGTDAVITYASGSGSATLVFNYVVQSGQNSTDLDYVATSSFDLNGATITDTYGNDPGTLSLPSPGASGSLADSKSLVIDTTGPIVTSVSSTTSDGTYRAGQTIAITVTFNETVNVNGTPKLTLETGLTDAQVNYSSGGGSAVLTFNYTIGASENSADLDYTLVSALSGGTVQDPIGNNADLTLPAPAGAGSLGANRNLVIDTTAATVTGVTSTSGNGTYKIGDVIPITVTFSESVSVTGTPRLTLETGTTDAVVDFVSAAGAVLTFNYTVAAGESAADLDYRTSAALALNGGTIRDAAGNDSTLLLADPGLAGSLGANRNLVIDGVRPVVTGVTSTTGNGSYTTGQTIAVTVTFDDNITVTGTPTLTLSTGAVVNYTSTAGATLTFNYTIAGGQTAADLDYAATTSLLLAGGTIRDSNGNDATLTLPTPGAAGSLGANRDLVVDTTAPTVLSVTSSTANGSYRAGQVVAIQVTFTEPVSVTGTPQLTLETGGTDAVVNYVSTAGSVLTFNYTIAGGENSADLDYVSNAALALNAGTIRDAVNIPATLTLPDPGTTGSLGQAHAIIVDTAASTVTDVTSSTANGTKGIGTTISIQVVMNEVVTVTGTPTLTLETGTSDRTVSYVSGTGSNTLNFTYTVGSDDESSDLDYASTAALDATGATIRDAAGNDATLTLAALGAAHSLANNKAFVVDGIRPTVSVVSSTLGNGTYGVGQTVPITVTFSEAVTVAGSPTLTLETGTSDAVLSFTSGSGTTVLTFNYVVRVNDFSTDLDYVDSSSLSANGGTLRDAAGNDAVLTLATVGQVGSLSDSKTIALSTPATGLAIDGTDSAGQAGYAVASVGDMNGDGKSDYAIAEPFALIGGTQKGRVKVYSGSTDAVLFTFEGAETGGAFGFSVAGAGDTNHDGRADIIIGAPLFNGGGTDRGKAYLYNGATGALLFQVTGTENNAQLGFSVGSAGDINRDGKIDFILGEPLANAGGTDRGKAYIYSGANGTVVLRTITGTEDNGQLGYAVAGAGDINLDGKGDFIVGEPFASNGGTARGVAHLYTANGTETQTLKCTEENNAHCGAAVALVGDLNRDGFSDVIVGEPLADATGSNRGKAFVYNGNTGATIYTVTGVESGAQLGFAVAGAGDVNRDGRPDFIVGEPYADNGGTDRGKAYLHSGATGAVLYTLAGTETDATFGSSVSGGGDFNRDGRSDFLVGAPLADGGGTDAGAAVRYTSGFTTLPALTPTLTYTIPGVEDNAFLGSSVANLGDIDGDSYDDFLVAEPKSGNDQGTVYVYSGATGAIKYTKTGSGENNSQYGYSAGGGGDVDGDGKNDFIVGEPFNAAGGKIWVYSGSTGGVLFSLESSEPGSQLGASVAIVGDVNGDSKDDFIISEPGADNGGTDRGIAYVISGADGATALHTIGGSIDSDFLGDKVAAAGDANGDGKMDFLVATSNNDDGANDGGLVVLYSGSTGDVLQTVSGSETGARLGYSIAGAGDVNGDGKADFIVGSPSAASGGTARGRAQVFNGSTGAVLYDITGTLNNAMLGTAVSGSGDVNGDGRADFILGAPYVNDVGTERGRVYVYSGGSGTSLYSITGQFDFAHFGLSVGGGGDANHDGFSDFMVGEPGEDGAGADRGNAYFYVAPSN